MRASTLPLLTIADLEATPDDGNRYEIIDGELYVSSAPSFLHQSVLANIFTAFLEYLKGNRIGKIVPGVGVIFDDHNGVVPDLVFLTTERRRKIVQGGRLMAAPEIVIEILSPGSSNQRRDRQIKLNLYSAREVGEYWIADPENRSVEIYRRNPEALELVGSLMSEERIESPVLPGFTVPVEDFFAD
jgi:Uma2 family endonuclease